MPTISIHPARIQRPARALGLAAVALLGLTATAPADSGKSPRLPDLSQCPNLELPPGPKPAFHVYAVGVQVYRWNGQQWQFVGPEAILLAETQENGVVGTHYAGPTWESVSGSRVVGAVVERATPDPESIPWLLLRAVSSEGPGIFRGVSYIHRFNTVGGLAPSLPGDFPGATARVPYAAEYAFYR